MFRESLLESSRRERKSKQWSMLTAFVLEIAVAAVLIILPLASTGIIPVSSNTPIIGPLRPITAEARPPEAGSSTRGTAHFASTTVVSLRSSATSICYLCKHASSASDDEPSADIDLQDDSDHVLDRLIPNANIEPPQPPPDHKRVKVSMIDPGRLIKRIEPEYPKLAVLTGVSGTVKLHAVISKEGTIETLTVISGHPMLAPAALQAVSQWRYRPYLLNGQAVEVETFITVNFHHP
jgi:protein TonB